MTETVYLLGAGFNYSIASAHWRHRPPLSSNFFRVLLKTDFRERLDAIRQNLYVDTLFELVSRYWRLSMDELEDARFDIEECLTQFESVANDETRGEDERLEHAKASHALRFLLLMYLSEPMFPASPAAWAFGEFVIRDAADVLTLNYDTAAEECIASRSGDGRRTAEARQAMVRHHDLPDEDLDQSDSRWNRNLAYGFAFDEVPMPTVPSVDVAGSRYYSHPMNKLYVDTRVLKLHGSVGWLRHTGQELRQGLHADLGIEGDPPAGIVLSDHGNYWDGEPPERNFWLMEPLIIPPVLHKDYGFEPFISVWDAALSSLSEAETLYVVGYSFPPTDFRVRRLLREAFAEHSLHNLVVVNPDSNVVNIVRGLIGFDGPVTVCNDLRSLYGVPKEFAPDQSNG